MKGLHSVLPKGNTVDAPFQAADNKALNIQRSTWTGIQKDTSLNLSDSEMCSLLVHSKSIAIMFPGPLCEEPIPPPVYTFSVQWLLCLMMGWRCPVDIVCRL